MINPVFEKNDKWYFNVGDGHPTYGPYMNEEDAWKIGPRAHKEKWTPALPEHLGGHNNVTHIDRGVLLYLKEKLPVYSMVDIGCGLGGMVQFARDREIEAYGVDGDFTLTYPDDIRKFITLHDYSTGPLEFKRTFDLGWTVEFLEHVEEKYQDNYMKSFDSCEYVVATAAPPGYPGHHHVNCREQDYWIEVFKKYGFRFDAEETLKIREVSTMRKPFMQTTGMFFMRGAI